MKTKFKSIRTEQEQKELFDLAEKLEQVSRMVKHLAKSNDRSEPVYAGVLRERLPEAWAALAIIENRFGDDNTGEQPRFSNDRYTEAAKAAGGVFVISKDADLDVIPYLPTTKNQRTFLTKLGREKLAEFAPEGGEK